MTKLYPVKDGEQIFLGSGTALNVYEKQRTELREIVRNDPNHFYTYSADYLSLSIDPYNAEDIKKAELEKKKNVRKSPTYQYDSNFRFSCGELQKASKQSSRNLNKITLCIARDLILARLMSSPLSLGIPQN